MNLSFNVPVSHPVNKKCINQGYDHFKNIFYRRQTKGLTKS